MADKTRIEQVSGWFKSAFNRVRGRSDFDVKMNDIDPGLLIGEPQTRNQEVEEETIQQPASQNQIPQTVAANTQLKRTQGIYNQGSSSEQTVAPQQSQAIQAQQPQVQSQTPLIAANAYSQQHLDEQKLDQAQNYIYEEDKGSRVALAAEKNSTLEIGNRTITNILSEKEQGIRRGESESGIGISQGELDLLNVSNVEDPRNIKRARLKGNYAIESTKFDEIQNRRAAAQNAGITTPPSESNITAQQSNDITIANQTNLGNENGARTGGQESEQNMGNRAAAVAEQSANNAGISGSTGQEVGAGSIGGQGVDIGARDTSSETVSQGSGQGSGNNRTVAGVRTDDGLSETRAQQDVVTSGANNLTTEQRSDQNNVINSGNVAAVEQLKSNNVADVSNNGQNMDSRNAITNAVSGLMSTMVGQVENNVQVARSISQVVSDANLSTGAKTGNQGNAQAMGNTVAAVIEQSGNNVRTPEATGQEIGEGGIGARNTSAEIVSQGGRQGQVARTLESTRQEAVGTGVSASTTGNQANLGGNVGGTNLSTGTETGSRGNEQGMSNTSATVVEQSGNNVETPGVVRQGVGARSGELGVISRNGPGNEKEQQAIPSTVTTVAAAVTSPPPPPPPSKTAGGPPPPPGVKKALDEKRVKETLGSDRSDNQDALRKIFGTSPVTADHLLLAAEAANGQALNFMIGKCKDITDKNIQQVYKRLEERMPVVYAATVTALNTSLEKIKECEKQKKSLETEQDLLLNGKDTMTTRDKEEARTKFLSEQKVVLTEGQSSSDGIKEYFGKKIAEQQQSIESTQKDKVQPTIGELQAISSSLAKFQQACKNNPQCKTVIDELVEATVAHQKQDQKVLDFKGKPQADQQTQLNKRKQNQELLAKASEEQKAGLQKTVDNTAFLDTVNDPRLSAYGQISELNATIIDQAVAGKVQPKGISADKAQEQKETKVIKAKSQDDPTQFVVIDDLKERGEALVSEINSIEKDVEKKTSKIKELVDLHVLHACEEFEKNPSLDEKALGKKYQNSIGAFFQNVTFKDDTERGIQRNGALRAFATAFAGDVSILQERNNAAQSLQAAVPRKMTKDVEQIGDIHPPETPHHSQVENREVHGH